MDVRTEYLEATPGLVKRPEITKELMRECVTVPGCCCCMPLLYNHLMDSCSYAVRKNTLLAAKGGCICTPLTPPKSATGDSTTVSLPTPQICLHLTVLHYLLPHFTCCHQKDQLHSFFNSYVVPTTVIVSRLGLRFLYSFLCSVLKCLPYSHLAMSLAILPSLQLFMPSLQP